MKKTSFNYSLDKATKQIINAIRKIDSPVIYILLKGDVGVGKTALVKRIMNELNVEFKKSPTFSFIEYYECTHRLFNRIYHIDFYKINLVKDKIAIWELNQVFENKGLFFIEWPTRVTYSLLSKKSFIINVTFPTFFECTISYILNEKKWVLFNPRHRFKKREWNYRKRGKETKYRVKRRFKKNTKFSQGKKNYSR